MTTVRLPLAGSQLNTRNGSLAYDALLQNCIVEQAGEDSAVIKRDGYSNIYTLAASYHVQGMWDVLGSLYWAETYIVAGTPYVRILYDGLPVGAPFSVLWFDGTLSFGEQDDQIWLASDPTNGKISVHSNTKLFGVTNTPVVKPTASNLAAGAAWLDGYFFIYSVDGNVYNSNINDPATWNSLGAIKPNVDIGYPTRLIRYINYIVTFGSTGYSAFYDAANPAPASPLSPVPNFNGKIGCISPNSVATVETSLFWLGRGTDGEVSVYGMSGHNVKKVSTPAIDRYIKQKLTTLSQTQIVRYLNGSSVTIGGHEGYYISLLGLFYDLTTGSWSYLTSSTSADNAWEIYFSALAYYSYNKTGIGKLSQTQYQESSTNIPIKIVTNEFDRSNNWKFVNDIDFISDKNIGSPRLRWTDDDFSTWSSYYDLDTTNNRSNIYRLGRTRRRAFELTHSDNTPFRAFYLEIDYDFGER